MQYHKKISDKMRGAANAEARRPIGIYVSNRSEGPRRRAIAIAKQAPGYFTLLGSGLKGKSDALPIVDLPAETSAGAALTAKNRRLNRIAEWIDRAKPALMLIDSSVEVAALARAKNIPTVYMRLAGKRTDSAHLQAFAAAEAVLCPFHTLLEADSTPQWLRQRSRYFPCLTESENLAALQTDAAAQGALPVILIAAGYYCGGKKHMAVSSGQLAAMAAALPDWRIQVIGSACPAELQQNCPANLQFYGWVNNPDSFIRRASLVVGTASDCLIAAVSAAGKAFVCVPQRRPFDEQYQKATKLAELRAATICRRWPRNWVKLIQKTLKRGAIMAALHEENTAGRAADLLLDLAHGAAHAGITDFAAQDYDLAVSAEPQAKPALSLQQKLAASLPLSKRGARRPAALWQKFAAKPARSRRAA